MYHNPTNPELLCQCKMMPHMCPRTTKKGRNRSTTGSENTWVTQTTDTDTIYLFAVKVEISRTAEMLRKGLQVPWCSPCTQPGLGEPLCPLCHCPSATTAAPHQFSSPSLSPPACGVHSSLSRRQMASTESPKQQSNLSA